MFEDNRCEKGLSSKRVRERERCDDKRSMVGRVEEDVLKLFRHTEKRLIKKIHTSEVEGTRRGRAYEMEGCSKTDFVCSGPEHARGIKVVHEIRVA